MWEIKKSGDDNIFDMNTNEFIKLELLKRRHGLLNEQKLIYDIQGYSLKCDYNIRKLLQNN